MDQLIRAAIAYLPADLEGIALNPPSLDSPSSFLPLVRFAWPFAKGVVVLLAFYIVWATLSGAFGYLAKFLRFTLRIGPIIGFIAWLMGNSGQGSMGDVFNIARQWTGLGGPGAHGAGPGLASLAGLFGGDQGGTARPNTRAGTRNARAAQNGGPDVMSSIFNTAVNWMGQGEGGGWQNVVQDYVKQVMGAAGTPQEDVGEDDRRKKRTGR